jgi:hypothetical protein
MGCNCNKGNNEEKLKIAQQILSKYKIDMAKKNYKWTKGVTEESTIVFKGQKIKVKDCDKKFMKLLFDTGHPAVEVEEVKKEDK